MYSLNILLAQKDKGGLLQLENKSSFQSQFRSSNICGPEASCSCTKSTNETDVYILNSCKLLANRTTLISKITVSKVRICQMENLVKYRYIYAEKYALTIIFQSTSIEHLVDMPEDCLPQILHNIIFEENPKLIIPNMERKHMFNLAKTQYMQSGILKFVDDVYLSVIVQFTNFTRSMKNLYTHSFYTKEPWAGLPSRILILEGNFIDFAAFLGLDVRTVTIQNVISLNGVQLVPDNFMNSSLRLRNISIVNSPHVKLPKNFFDFVCHSFDGDRSLTLDMDIVNVQQNLFVGKYLVYLIRINQIAIDNGTRAILQSRINVEGCSSFCRRNGSNASESCSKLSDYEKRVCGICVTDKIGPADLKMLKKVCSIDSITPTTSAKSDIKTGRPNKTINNEEGSHGYTIIQQKTYQASSKALRNSFLTLIVSLILKIPDK